MGIKITILVQHRYVGCVCQVERIFTYSSSYLGQHHSKLPSIPEHFHPGTNAIVTSTCGSEMHNMGAKRQHTISKTNRPTNTNGCTSHMCYTTSLLLMNNIRKSGPLCDENLGEATTHTLGSLLDAYILASKQPMYELVLSSPFVE